MYFLKTCKISVGNRQTKFHILNCECGTHAAFEFFEFSLSVSHQNYKNLAKIFFLCQNRESEVSIDILIVYKILLRLRVKGI